MAQAMSASELAALPGVLTVEQAASALGVARRTLYDQMHTDGDPFPPGSWIRIGTVWRLPRWRLYAALGRQDPDAPGAAA